METTSREVIATFAVTPQARELLHRWQADPARPQVPRVVLAHATKVLYQLEPDAIEGTCRASEHPLGSITKAVASRVQPVVDWRPDFAFTHVMHLALERLGRLPTFQDFVGFCGGDPLGRTALGDPARQIRESTCRQGYPAGDVAKAVRWRIGLAYYSFVREVYTIAVLRGCGLDVRAHPLADALFRVDAWTGRTVLSLYIRNAAFRDGDRGRKPLTSSILAGARPGFRYQELSLPTRHEFGCVHLPEAARIRQIAQEIRDAQPAEAQLAGDQPAGQDRTPS
jgi:hypothetical protein